MELKKPCSAGWACCWLFTAAFGGAVEMTFRRLSPHLATVKHRREKFSKTN